MAEKLFFYFADKQYIDYLQKIEPKVTNVSYEKRDKFLCGVVLNINGKSYFSPVSSFNKKQKTNFLIADKHNNIVASLRLSYMFPVPENKIEFFDFENLTDEKYKELLRQEYSYINTNSDAIREKAKEVYAIGKDKKHYLNQNCCDFEKLENEATESGFKRFLKMRSLKGVLESAAQDFNEKLCKKTTLVEAERTTVNGEKSRCFIEVQHKASDFFEMLGFKEAFQEMGLDNAKQTDLFFNILGGKVAMENVIREPSDEIFDRLENHKSVFSALKVGAKITLNQECMAVEYKDGKKLNFSLAIPSNEVNGSMKKDKALEGVWSIASVKTTNEANAGANAALQPNPAAAQPTVSAAAASMLGNMPTVQAQNPQRVHTNQNKNDNITE